MTRGRASIKLQTLFVLAFICLNAGGALCLARCTSAEQAGKVHCPLANGSNHCPLGDSAKTNENKGPEFSAMAMTCCSMPVSLVAAPLEERASHVFKAVDIVPVETPAFEFAPVLLHSAQGTIPVYRPPPLDRRIERTKNCVIRI